MQGEVADNSMLANLLPFQRQIVQELIAEDGLCILSAGMGVAESGETLLNTISFVVLEQICETRFAGDLHS